MRRLTVDERAMALLYERPREVAGHLLRKCWRDECPQRAAALAYTTLLSLVPFLVVAFAMLKGFGGLKAIQERLESLLYTHLVTTSSLQATGKLLARVSDATLHALGPTTIQDLIDASRHPSPPVQPSLPPQKTSGNLPER